MSGWLREAGLGAQLNVLVGDGRALVASRLAVAGSKGEEAPSLYALSRGAGHACIASEPYDDDQRLVARAAGHAPRRGHDLAPQERALLRVTSSAAINRRRASG